MRYIKTYDSIEPTPRIGDYVVCQDLDEENVGGEQLILHNEFLSSNIGKIVDIKIPHGDKEGYTGLINYYVQYDNMDTRLRFVNPIPFRRFEIIEFSPNREDLEYLIQAHKYNL